MAKPRPTWLAVIVCVIAVIMPGLFVGGIFAFVYRMLVGSDPTPDPFGLHMIFGVDVISKVVLWIRYVGLSQLVQGGIAGAVAAGLTVLICRGANVIKAAFVTGLLYTAFILVLFVWSSVIGIGITSDAIGSVLQLIGLWVGLISVGGYATAQSQART